MKKTIFLAAAAVLMLASCNKWLDVKSDTQVIGKDLFSQSSGFHTAMNGVYSLISSGELYSRELNYATLSVLANNYDAALLPAAYTKLAGGLYDDAECRTLVQPIWNRAFETVANCNDILRHARQKGDDFFPGGAAERNDIIGQMLAVRAMVQMDMLRLFAPTPALAGDKVWMPYVENYPDRQPTHLTAACVMELVIRDLSQARTLLPQPTAKPAVDRVSGIAATALLARAHQWNGQAAQARAMAQEVLTFNATAKWYTTVFAAENVDHRKMPEDMILAAWNQRAYDLLREVRGKSTDILKDFCYKNQAVLFGADTDDFRMTKLMVAAQSIPGKSVSARWQISESSLMPAEAPLAPIVRLSEMIYIAAEWELTQGDPTKGLKMLSDLRFDRGAKGAIAGDPLEALYNDMTREFMSEGQSYFLYKRLNRPIFNGALAQEMTYLLPTPRSETDYTNL